MSGRRVLLLDNHAWAGLAIAGDGTLMVAVACGKARGRRRGGDTPRQTRIRRPPVRPTTP